MSTHKHTVIGIAGGSGSGKTTLAIGLYKKYPDKIALVHLDDYFKKQEDVPVENGFVNWDHPDAIRFDDLYHDIVSLMHGHSIMVMTKSELYNPHYDPDQENRIPHVINPKPVIVVEGYFAFHDPHMRGLCTKKIYLDIPIREALKRRTKAGTEEYFQKILIPMHEKYIEPTKQYADLVVDTAHTNIEQACRTVEGYLKDVLR